MKNDDDDVDSSGVRCLARFARSARRPLPPAGLLTMQYAACQQREPTVVYHWGRSNMRARSSVPLAQQRLANEPLSYNPKTVAGAHSN